MMMAVTEMIAFFVMHKHAGIWWTSACNIAGVCSNIHLTPTKKIFRLLFKHSVSPCSAHCANVRRIRCEADLNSSPLGELEETTRMPPYYVDEDYPAGPGISEPLPEQSS